MFRCTHDLRPGYLSRLVFIIIIVIVQIRIILTELECNLDSLNDIISNMIIGRFVVL